MTRLDSLLFRVRDVLERHDDEDRVRYEFPGGWMIAATNRGVMFVGTSVNFDASRLELVENVVKWARVIHQSLASQLGIPPQAECESKLVMVVKNNQAWWKGDYKNRVKAESGTAATKLLRTLTRDAERQSEESDR